jgi:WD40 repeat protein
LERGRERLRNRLVRRGVVLSAALSATLLADGATAAVPPPLESGVVSAAVQFASGRPASACGGSTLAAILAQGAVKSMTSTIWKIAAAFVLFAGAIGTVAFAIPGSEPPPKNAGPVSNNPPAQEPAPVRATFIEERGGKPPMRFYHVKLELTNPRDRPVWLLLGYYGDQPLNPDAKFATDSDGSPQTITGMFFDGDKNKGWGKVIELHAGGDKGFRAILLPPRATIRFDNYAISAWNAVNTIQVWEASDLAVNGKTPLQNWLPYAAMSDQKARIAPNTDGTNLDWDAKASKSRTDYLNEKITSIDAAVLKKWVVPIEGMPPAKPQPPAGAAPVGPAPSPPGIAIEWQHVFEAKLAGAGAGKVEFSPDGRLLASTAKFPGRPQMWNVASGEEVPLQKFGGRTSFLQFNRDGQPLGTSYLDGAERDPKTVLTGFDMWTHKDWFNVELRDEDGIRCYRHVALSPGGQTLALSDWPDKVSIYDLKTGEKQFDLPAGGGRAVQPVRFAPNAKSVAVAYAANDSGAKKSGHVVKLWAVDDLAPSNARPKWSVETLDPGIDLIFTPDGKRLVVGLQNSAHVLVLDSENGKERMQLGSNTDSKRHTFLAFSPDGRTVAANWKSGEESGVVLWDIETGKTQTILKEPKQPVFALAFSRDGTRLAAADMGNFLHVWTRK